MQTNRSENTHRSTVAIVGAGQLGSRYVQGLVNCSNPLSIWVVDPSEVALSRAQERWLEASGGNSAHVLVNANSISDLPQKLDLALITTSADVRDRVAADVASHADVKYWVLEKVLAQSSETLDALLKATSGADGRWVNTPRRMMHWYQQLHAKLADQQPMHVRVGDNSWGLACNAIHFLDLVAWMCNAELVSMDTHGLDASWRESKRPGFFEITGTLKGTYANGSTIQLESREQGHVFEIQVDTPQGRWTINEGQAIGTTPDGQTIIGRMEYQSEMSARLVDSILASGNCALPTLEASAQIHRPFLQAMLDHWNKSGLRNDSLVPVT